MQLLHPPQVQLGQQKIRGKDIFWVNGDRKGQTLVTREG